MNTRRLLHIPLVLALVGLAGQGAAAQSVTLTASHPNAVSFWNDVANRTVLAQIPAATTPEEQRPSFVHDPATVHLAIYDAVMAIEGRYRTPNHPEYPAAHSCTSGALGQALRHVYGIPDVTFSLDSRITGTTRSYAGAEAFNQENRVARIAGGMHFEFSAVAGEEIGQRVADWVAARHFGRP